MGAFERSRASMTPTNAVYVGSSLGFESVPGLAGQLVSVGTQESICPISQMPRFIKRQIGFCKYIFVTT